MAVREDLVNSAVTFLQDPSVASSPIEKRIEFLRSKNLTQDEVELSLTRAENDPSSPSQPPQSQYYPPQQYRRPAPQGFGYNYNPYAEFQAPPPELPKRDWRDWFIMATVAGGASYGLWVLTQRYVKPLIAPPTPPQLEQDKTAIDEQFNRAFTLIDTLSSDTTALKEAEEARTQKLDSVLADVELVVAELKRDNTRREEDARRMIDEITRLKDSLPTAIEGVKQGSERQLKELSTELASLKTLMGNRMAGGSSGPYISNAERLKGSGNIPLAPSAEPTPGSNSNITGVNSAATVPSYGHSSSSAARPVPTPSRSGQFTGAPATYGSGSAGGGKAAIPAWQMAAQNKAKETPPTNGNINGTENNDGADAVVALAAS